MPLSYITLIASKPGYATTWQARKFPQ